MALQSRLFPAGAIVRGFALAATVLTSQTIFRAQAAPAGTPTFTRDVVPIFQRSCQRCHRPGSIGPMSLITYEDARPWARSIKSHVASREMPPYHIDRTIGIQQLADDPALTQSEIDTIVRWADGGAPRGNPADMPPAVQWAPDDRWSIGKPDVILTLRGGDLTVAAQNADQWLDLPLEDAKFTEDVYVKAIEIKPIKGTPTVHHANASWTMDPATGFGGNHLVEYAVGKGGEVYPEGSGKLIKAGSTLMMNVHLHAIGEVVPANVALGLKLYPKGVVPKHVEVTRHVGDEEEGIDIPPGSKDARADGYTILSVPTRLTAFQPHMHNRGKRQCLEAIYPAGGDARRGGLARKETLSCANFHFAWHLQYHYAEDAQPLLPAGTILHVISWYDNSPANKYNPDPGNWVGFGQRTIDEMSFTWVTMYSMTQAEFDQAVKEREAKRATASRSQQQ